MEYKGMMKSHWRVMAEMYVQKLRIDLAKGQNFSHFATHNANTYRIRTLTCSLITKINFMNMNTFVDTQIHSKGCLNGRVNALMYI